MEEKAQAAQERLLEQRDDVRHIYYIHHFAAQAIFLDCVWTKPLIREAGRRTEGSNASGPSCLNSCREAISVTSSFFKVIFTPVRHSPPPPVNCMKFKKKNLTAISKVYSRMLVRIRDYFSHLFLLFCHRLK